MDAWLDFLSKVSDDHKSVVEYNWEKDSYLKIDLSDSNQSLKTIDLNDQEEFTNFIFDQLKEANMPFAVGGYAEKRSIYSRSHLFEGEEPRSIHLGIDVWGKAGTEVYAPIDAMVHSFANNAVHGDYGPVIILKHAVANEVFHTLYGHLSKHSLEGLYEGKVIKAGERIGTFGVYAENFHWPPHLHFQVIKDMQGYKGDYPGVCKASETGFYLNNCPNPSLLLGL